MMDKSDLANWIVRLNAKGEALKAGRGEGDLLRRVALVTCAKSVAEVQLFRQQRSQQRTRYGSGSNGGGNGGRVQNRLKRSHTSSFSSDSCPVSGGPGAPDAPGGGSSFGGSSCSCDSCSLCSNYQASGANSCYCRAIGAVKPTHLLSDDEESKLIDDFLTSLDGVPNNKKCKRL